MSEFSEEQIQSEFERVLFKYASVDAMEKELKHQKENLRNQIAELMHKYKKNEVIVHQGFEFPWKCAYQTSERKEINYDKLHEVVGSILYNEIVNLKSSTALNIRQIKKKTSKSEKINQAPDKDKLHDDFTPPIGNLA